MKESLSDTMLVAQLERLEKQEMGLPGNGGHKRKCPRKLLGIFRTLQREGRAAD
jgi:hypothetical protein